MLVPRRIRYDRARHVMFDINYSIVKLNRLLTSAQNLLKH